METVGGLPVATDGLFGQNGATPPSPLVWAYVGDAVYELYVRGRVATEGTPLPVRRLHRRVVSLVRAEAQAEALARLEPVLTDEERDVVRRGRNAESGSTPAQSPAIRSAATAFEALIGFLYLEGRSDRLNELLALAVDDGIEGQRSGGDENL